MYVALVLGVFFYLHTGHSQVPQIRVRIQKSLSKVLIGGMDMERMIYFNNDHKVHKGRKVVKFHCRGLGFFRPTPMAYISSPTGFLTVEKERYRGSISLISSEGGDRCDIVNETSMEDYIGGLLSKEMNASWPLEALKSQAVAARTYALYMMRSRRVSRQKKSEAYYDLESSEKHQVGGSFFDSTRKTARAAYETQGYILKMQKTPLLPIFYHAKCGGRLFSPHHVWENPVPGHLSNYCGGCEGLGTPPWKTPINLQRFKKFLAWLERKRLIPPGSLHGRRDGPLRLAPDNFPKRHIRVYLKDKAVSIKKSLLRRYFGRTLISSNNFKVSLAGRTLLLQGKGRGHGVGMCQLGALGLARQGWNFEQILKHYFPKHKLVKVY